MTSDTISIDRDRIHELFDTRKHLEMSGVYEDDPNPKWNTLRNQSPIHEGTPGTLIGFEGPERWYGLPEPDRKHFTVFDFATCDALLKDSETYRMAPPDKQEIDENSMLNLVSKSMLSMDGPQHRDYRELVQPSFRSNIMHWWMDKWGQPTIDALIDGFKDRGRADLHVEFFAPIPLLTICGSFGVSIEDALDIRAAVQGGGTIGLLKRLPEVLMPIIKSRRIEPRDDLISVLTKAELTNEHGERHVLSDLDILSFSWLLLSAGSGTTWKQMGITLVAMLQQSHWIEAVRKDASVLDAIVDESARWMPTDPVFSRYAHQDVNLHGIEITRGSVVHLCYGAANRDPHRWDRPDVFDPGRKKQPHLGFGRGIHVCLGKHLAKTEIIKAITALVDRLPNLRIDPDAEQPQIIGLYERASTTVPVLWG